jgi:predicted membrane-bound mannosyltransferase
VFDWLVGRKRWIVAAVIFRSVHILFTSVFTNLGGWRTGMVGSLGYWLEQHGVQRGSQPWFYYLFVTPFYEFLPLIFALLGIHLWTKQRRQLAGVVLGTAGTAAVPVYSLTNWLVQPQPDRRDAAQQHPRAVGGRGAAGRGRCCWALWFSVRRQQLAERLGLVGGWRELVDLPAFVGFVRSLIWWMLLAWPAYSIAGEKMPWLSTHLTIPMALLAGWYLGQRVESVAGRALLSRRALAAIGLWRC